MTINQFQPRFRGGGEPVPAIASGTVAGGTFVKIHSDKDTDGNYVVEHCVKGDVAFGVAEYDGDVALGSRLSVVRAPAIARVVPGGSISAGDLVQADANGKAIVFDDAATPLGAVLGVALMDATTADNSFVEVDLNVMTLNLTGGNAA